MKKVIVGSIIILSTLAISTSVQAAGETANGTLALSGEIVGSITLTVEEVAGSGTFGGDGTATATADLGTFSKYGAAPATGFTRTQGASNWTIASNFGVRVVKANSASANYTLTAALNAAPTGSIAWTIDATPLTTALLPISTAVAYSNTPVSYAFTIAIPDATATPVLDNTINFVATAN
ncbi:MAG: hypothetical protein ABI779_08740 [Acidobacteriota bacterium]